MLSNHGLCVLQHAHYMLLFLEPWCPQILPPCIFSTVLLRYFIPHISPPAPTEKTHPAVEILFKPLGCLPLKYLLRTQTAHIKDGRASYFVEALCFFAPQLSLPLVSGASLCLVLGPHPPLTMRSCFNRREG